MDVNHEKSISSHFDSSKACLVLAPLFEFPIRSGDNVLVHNRWSSFSCHVPYVDVIGHNVLVRYQKGKIVSRVYYDNSAASKYMASIKVILYRSHYLVEKYFTGAFQKEAIKHLLSPEYGTIVYCYIWTTLILNKLQTKDVEVINQKFQIIETINDEVQWYKNIRNASQNILAKLTAWLSEKWIINFFSKITNQSLFIHLTEADYQSYLRYFPNHISVIAPVGTRVKYEEYVPEKTFESHPFSSSICQLLFVGSLNVQMNFDALLNFKQKFYPHLHQKLDKKIQVTVVGKAPTRKVKELCSNMDWRLFADVTDAQLHDFYKEASFAILPFSYTSGAKLKLLDSVAFGVPFLATKVLDHQIDSTIYPCLFSDKPEEWLQRIQEVGPGTLSEKYRLDLQQFAKTYSWDALTLKLFDDLEATFHE